MRITIVQGAFFPVPTIMGGAVEKVWHGLGREFVRRGHEVTHISRRHPKLPHTETLDGVRHIRVSGFSQPRSLALLKLRDLIYTLAALRRLPPADIIVGNTFWLPLLLRHERRGKLVVHVARFPRGQMRHYRHAACLQAVSGAVADAIQAELGAGTSTQVCVVPNPIARRASLPPPASARGNHILYTGRLHPEKGLHLLLNAWRLASPRLEGWKLRIVGPWRAEQGGGGSAFLETLHRAAAGIPVDFVEPIFDIEELNREYASASFFVYPSLAALGESFGLAPLEAMAFATPAIVSGLACFRDFISPGENGLVFDHMGGAAAAELADRIALLGTNTALRLQLGAAAWETSARFTESAVADSYLAEFVRLLR